MHLVRYIPENIELYTMYNALSEIYNRKYRVVHYVQCTYHNGYVDGTQDDVCIQLQKYI